MGRTVKVILGATVSDFTAKMRDAGNAVKGLTSEIDKAAKAGKLDHLSDQAGKLGLGLTAAFGFAVKAAADFDKAMSGVSAATNANVQTMGKLRAAALQAGKDTQFSATQAADGITELAKAGVSTTAILGGGLKGALNLAAAGQIAVGDAAEIAASAMTQFKLSGSQVPHVADLLAAAAGKAQGSVGDMGQALNQSGLVAAQFGLSIEDTTGVLAEFASAGLLGSDAGTSLKTMLLALSNPSQQTKDEMDKLNISFYDAQGNFVGLSGVAQVLQSRLKGLTAEQRNQALGQIFGNDAIRSASILYTDGAKGVAEWKNKVNDAGYASDNAAKLTDNLAGDIERLKGSLETLAIESGSGANSGLRLLAKTANEAVDAFAGLPPAVSSTLTVLSGVSGVSLLAMSGFVKARKAGADFLETLSNMGPLGSRAATGLGKVAGIGGKLGLAGLGAVGLYEGFSQLGKWIDSWTAPTVRNVDKMTDALKTFGETGKATGELAKTFGTDLAGVQKDIKTVTDAQAALAKIQSGSPAMSIYAGRGGGAAPDAASKAKAEVDMKQSKANLDALDQALSNLVTSGNATAAKTLLDAVSGGSASVAASLPKYQQAASAAASANSGLAKGFGNASSSAKTLSSDLRSAMAAGQGMTDVWNELHGAMAGSDHALLDAKNAIEAVKQSFKDNGKAIEGNSLKALKNRTAVEDAAQAAAKAAQAKYEETGSVEAANKVYGTSINQLFKTAKQSGLTKGEIKKLRSEIGSMPPLNIHNNLDSAASKAQALQNAIAGIQSHKTVEIAMHITGATNASAVAAGLRKQYANAAGGVYTRAAAGGLVQAEIAPPGTRYQWAEPETGGEAFIPRRGNRARGRELLEVAAGWYGMGLVPMARGGIMAAAAGLVNVAPSTSTVAPAAPTGSKLDYLQSYISARNAVAALSAALKENGRSFSLATAKGRDNRNALYDGVKAAQDAAKAKYDETGSVTQANKVYDEYIARLKAALKQQHINSSTIKSLLGVAQRPTYDVPAAAAPAAPKNSSGTIKMVSDQSALEEQIASARQAFAWTKPSFNVGTAAGRSELQELFSVLSSAQTAAQSVFDVTGNAKTATSFYTSYISELKGILLKSGLSAARVNEIINRYGKITLQPTANRDGGVYEHAAGGSLRDAQIASAGPTQYAWAEPETGGELFAPKNGNLSKTRREVGWAVQNWWGGQVSWQRGAGSGSGGAGHTVVIDATIPITLGTETISRQVRIEVDAAVGQVTAATVYQTA